MPPPMSIPPPMSMPPIAVLLAAAAAAVPVGGMVIMEDMVDMAMLMLLDPMSIFEI